MVNVSCHHLECIHNKNNQCWNDAISINEFVAYDGTVFDVCSAYRETVEPKFVAACRHQGGGMCEQCRKEVRDRKNRAESLFDERYL